MMNFTRSNQQFSQEGLSTNNIDSLDSDASRWIFSELLSRRPTFKEALEDVGIQDESVFNKSIVISGKVLGDSDMKRIGLTNDEIMTISYFFLDKSGKSIFSLVNEILNNKRNKGNFSTVIKLIFLILSGLRKLPRFEIPSNQTYYSGIKYELPQTKEEANDHHIYSKGKVVTWRGFTSITTNLEVINSSIKDEKEKALFHIRGENVWGYDISLFSQSNDGESELILEPEARVLVNDVLVNGTCTTIHVTLQQFDHLVLEDIIPVTNVNTVSCMKSNFTHGFTRNEEKEIDTFSKSINREKANLNIPFDNFADNFTKKGNKYISREKSELSENVCVPDSTLNDKSASTLSISFSSERFNSNDFEEETTINSIDESNNLFSGLKKKETTLEEALESMGYEKYKELSNDFLERGKDKLMELESTGIAANDIAAIFCYTFEWNEEARGKYGDGENPYRKLNNSLSIDRSNKTLKKTRHFLFLLLKALRKLPRFIPENPTLYRGIKFLVQTEPDPEFPKRKPYAAGNEKFWWTFTSTSLSLEATQSFIRSNGSLFMLSGETWGYDISMFSDFPDEKEILLEPERKLSITSISRDENIITVNANILDTSLVLKDIIKVGKTVKIKERRSKVKEVPQNLKTTSVTENTVELSWNPVNKVISYQISSRKTSNGLFNRNQVNMLKTKETNCVVKDLERDAEYEFRVRCVFDDGMGGWSEVIKVMPFSWKKCPKYVDKKRKYSIGEKNPRIVIKIGEDDNDCTIIGNIFLPPNKVTSWNIKIINSKDNDGFGIIVGVAPFDINQDEKDNYDKCGWYFDCWNSSLYSGPHHNYRAKEYGPREKVGKYVHTGDTVGVVMDTTNGELSFVLNGVNYGVAYEGIPLDKPLVPCVILSNKGDSIKLMISEARENINLSIPIPPNFIVRNGITWDSITLTWDDVEWSSFYQIEADGSILYNMIKTNTFTKRGYPPNTEHSFRVRTVKNNSVSEWSGVVKGRIPKESFETSWWKECPDDVNEEKKYSIGGDNFRIATKNGNDNGYCCCTVIGNTPLPSNIMTSWNIKILKSKYNDGNGIYIGVAPFDINQYEEVIYSKCGWYFGCFKSSLHSGPPHKYEWKKYGPRNWDGGYVHTGDIVSVIMDTSKGELSFVIKSVNHGVAYEEIPLDKPLVPCVLLKKEGDSVELDLSGVKETMVDNTISVPSNVIIKSITWDSTTLTWNNIEGAPFYQIKVDEKILGITPKANSFTKYRLFPETEHSFRIRTVKDNTVSEWSDIIKGTTLKAPEFSKCIWKECPDYVDWEREYSVDNNPRVATNICRGYCTITGNTYLPLNKVTSWSIKILKSENNEGYGIYIGVAPFDIDQNDKDNYDKCGWYFYCWKSTLWSGPPHKHEGKEYGPRKKDGDFVHTGDSIGVVMDTSKGELSFVLNGVNHGVVFKGIPLYKPLVPCVLLYYEDDSVELII